MNVSSQCVDNFHYVVPIGYGNSFRLVLESHGKVMENDFPKRVVTLVCTAHHSGFHFVDGMEVELLFTAVDALDDVVSLGVVVQYQKAG